MDGGVSSRGGSALNDWRVERKKCSSKFKQIYKKESVRISKDSVISPRPLVGGGEGPPLSDRLVPDVRVPGQHGGNLEDVPAGARRLCGGADTHWIHCDLDEELQNPQTTRRLHFEQNISNINIKRSKKN